MLQKAADKRCDRQRTRLRVLGLRDAIAERHLVVRDGNDPVVTQCDAKNVGCPVNRAHHTLKPKPSREQLLPFTGKR